MSKQIDQLLADGRIRQINPGAAIALYETIHPVKPSRKTRLRRGPRNESHLAHSSPRTKPSLTSRRHDRRAESKAARRARRANR